MTYVVLDLETITKEHLGRTASFLVNDIVAVGFKHQNEKQARSYYKSGVEFQEIKFINVLVGHNIKFDLLYLWKYEEFQDYLARGGKIWCTQLAEYILSGQQHKYPALRDIAVNKYGCKEREKVMEKYWDQGICTSQIPEELVRYDVENDVLDTEKVMLGQIKLLKKDGMFNLALEMMEGLLATTEMEYNGIYINQEIMNKNQQTLEKELEVLYTDVNKLAEGYWK